MCNVCFEDVTINRGKLGFKVSDHVFILEFII